MSSALALDYICRNFLSQPSLTLGVIKQLPVLPPDRYSENDINYITPASLNSPTPHGTSNPSPMTFGIPSSPFPPSSGTKTAALKSAPNSMPTTPNSTA